MVQRVQVARAHRPCKPLMRRYGTAPAARVTQMHGAVWRDLVIEALHDDETLERRTYQAAYAFADHWAMLRGRPRIGNADFATWYTVNRGMDPTALEERSIAHWHEFWLAGHPGVPGILEKTS